MLENLYIPLFVDVCAQTFLLTQSIVEVVSFPITK